jgi:hypothetical protein
VIKIEIFLIITKSFQVECLPVGGKPERMDYVYSFLSGAIPTFQVPAAQAIFDLKGFCSPNPFRLSDGLWDENLKG